jgi:hypothetical protein
MFSFITSYFYNPAEDEIRPTEEQKQNRYKLLKEIKSFNIIHLLPVPQSIEEFTQENKKKIFTFKRKKRKRKRKKSTS